MVLKIIVYTILVNEESLHQMSRKKVILGVVRAYK